MTAKKVLDWTGVMDQLKENIERVDHGEVTLTFKIHEKHIVHVIHSFTQMAREPGGLIVCPGCVEDG